jgi:hypothetical protein
MSFNDFNHNIVDLIDDFIFYTCFQEVFWQSRKVGLLVICKKIHLEPH